MTSLPTSQLESLANFVVLFLSAVKSKCVRSSNGSSCPEISQSAGHNQTVCTDEIIFVLTQLKKKERLLLFARRWVWVGDLRRASNRVCSMKRVVS